MGRTGHRCEQGHDKTQRPGGDWVCKPCVNRTQRDRRRLQRLGCTHRGDAFEGATNVSGKMICLTCVVEEANGQRVAKP